ncbi:MAG: hypothetical protein RJA22_2234 [Verrucomicrobiota bacterium]
MKRLPLLLALACGLTASLLSVPRARADGAVVFHEIMYHPATDESLNEWVELRNLLAVDVDISDWSLAGGIAYRFPSNSILRGGQHLVVAAAPSVLAAQLGVTNVYGPFLGRLDNAGALLQLRNNSGRVVDELDYGTDGEWPVGPDGAGVSLAKRDPDSASGPAANWTASEQMGGTPGARNFVPVGNAAPEMRHLTVTGGWLYEASGTDLGTAWRDPAFNDTAWASRHFLTNRAIPGLYNTGLGVDGNAAADGTADPHYVLTYGAQGTVGAGALIIQNHPAWMANDANSKWIGVTNPGSTSISGGGYGYRTTFSLPGFLLSTVELNLSVAIDNAVTNVFLNGAARGISYAGFAGLSTPFTLSGGFVSGLNTLEFGTENQGPGPGGFRAQLAGSGLAVNADAPPPAGRVTYYARTRFPFTGNPQFTALKLNAILADGAIFYLNGVEVYRHNLPAGPVSHTTPALADVAPTGYLGQVAISAASLVSGTNVLAVEIHQAAGSPDGPVVGVELVSTPLPRPPTLLAFNELSASTNASFWLELVNHGSTPLALAGVVIRRDAATGPDQEYVFPAGPVLAAGGYLALTNQTLGFLPVDGDRLFLLPAARDEVLDAVVVTRGARARVPAGSGPFLRPTTPSPGAANLVTLRDEVVINEIMFSPKRLPSTNGLPPAASGEKWVELHNRSSNAVDLTGWEFDGGIRYRFGAGTLIPAGGYLVVARDATALRAKFPAADIVGDYSGTLSGNSDHLVLKDAAGNPADEVRYFSGGRWAEYASGGGSSLELRNPAADNARAESWAASIESSNTAWQTVSYRMVAGVPTGSGQPTTWNDFVLGLQGAGECLIDDLSVIETPATTPVQVLANTNFDAGLAGWRVVGTHNRSRVIPEPGNPGNAVLHLVATGPQEHMHNHIETTLTGGRTIVNGREYQVSYRARWLAGNSLLNTRLYFNRVARTVELAYPTSTGTPGRRNSRWEANVGPTFTGLQHAPVIPAPGTPVTVTVRAEDPDGVASAELWWSVNSGAWNSASLAAGGSGFLTGSIPGGAAGDVVQFYVRAVDGLGAAAMFPALGPDSGALYKVNDGQANLALSHNVRVIVTPAIANVMHGTAQGVNQTNVMSNELFPCTIVYDETRPYYDCAVHLRGSQRGRYSDVRTGFHIEFQPDDLFRGVHPVMLVDRSGAGDSVNNRQEEIILKHMLNRAGGLPGTYGEIARVIAPRSAHTGPCQFFPRHEDAFMETAFGDDGEGRQFEMELIYYPTTADAGGYKLPQPDGVIGTDMTDLGSDEEIYRYNFMIKNQRDTDDYRDFILFCKTLSLSGAQLETQVRQIMDVNQWMRAYAMASLGSVGDMYSFGNNHNFFTYQRATDRKFVYMPWDMDFTFTRGATGALVGDQNIAKVVNLPANLRCLYAHMLDIIGTCFNTSYMGYWTTHYASFAPGQSYAGHLTTIGSRASYVQTTINGAGGNSPFAITSATNLVTGTNLVVLTGTAPVTAHTIRVNGREYPITWSTISSWTLRVPVSEALQVLTITPHDLRGNPLTNFSRTVTVSYTGAAPDPAGIVAINEIMYNPVAPDASYIELINTSSNLSFDLSGWRLNGVDYTFPAGSVITNRGLLVLARNAAAYVLAYGSAVPAPFDTYPGSLDNDGETLTLFRPGPLPGSEWVVDKVRYDRLPPWPARANGLGASLQVVDPTQDNARVANWSDGAGWRYYSVTASSGPGTATAFAIFLSNLGELYVDNLSLVQGTTPTAGPNLLANSSFENGLASWGILGNHSNSTVVTGVALSGTNSLRMLAAGVGAATSSAITQAVAGVVTNLPYTVSFWFLPSTSTTTGINYRVTSSLRSLTTIDVRSGLPTPGTPNSVAAALTPFPPLWLNEVQPVNAGGLLDGQGEAEPWIEVHNAGTSAVSLAGCHLSGSLGFLNQWAFPPGAVLEPGEFRVVFCDGEPGESTATEWHANFRPSSTNGSVTLSWSPGGAVQMLDYLTYGVLPAGGSHGAFPDGQPWARQDFAVATPGGTNSNASLPLTVFLNEWMADNTGSLVNTNHNNQLDDWFELYNPGPAPADLRGHFLTDDPAQPRQFEIPPGYVIPAGGHLLVWADGRPDLNRAGDPALHVGFQLSRGGEGIALLGGDGRVVDAVTFPAQEENLSQGRQPDGAGTVYFLAAPTPGAPNSLWLNRPPVLAPIPDLEAYAGFPLTFTAAAVDPDVPPQLLTYSLDPGAPTNASVHPVSGVFSWTPEAGQSGSTNAITLRVTDNGPLGLTDARTFAVVVRTGLVLGGVTPGPAGTIQFSVGTVPGRTYRLQYKNGLADPGWTDLPPDRVATGSSLLISDAMGAQPQRFYRVVQVD